MTWKRSTTREIQIKAEAYSYTTAVRRQTCRKNMEDNDGERRNRTKMRSEGREGEQRKMDFGEVEGRSEVDGLYAAGKGRKKKKTTKGGGGGRRD